jgi:hypothetical protein
MDNLDGLQKWLKRLEKKAQGLKGSVPPCRYLDTTVYEALQQSFHRWTNGWAAAASK